MFAMRMEHGAAYDCVIEDDCEQAAGDLRSQDSGAGLECEKENRIIQCGSDQGDQAEAQKNKINLQRIQQRIEMRSRIACGVDGPNGLLYDCDRAVLGEQEHVQLELIAARGDFE